VTVLRRGGYVIVYGFTESLIVEWPYAAEHPSCATEAGHGEPDPEMGWGKALVVRHHLLSQYGNSFLRHPPEITFVQIANADSGSGVHLRQDASQFLS
jgi:hypothetical protein